MNDNKIVTAFKENLSKRKVIAKKVEEMGKQFTDITNLIGSVRDTYCVVFKRIGSGGKNEVCDIEDIFNSRHSYYSSDDKDKKVKLFLSSEGFAINRGSGSSMVKHIHKIGSERDFVRALNRFVKYKNEIWAKIKQVEKKERFSKFVKAYEDNKLNILFDDVEDYNYFQYELGEEKTIYYFDDIKITDSTWKKMAIDTQNPNDIKLLDTKKKKSWVSSESIYFTDMEKLEQVYDEVMSFIDNIITRQHDIQVGLEKFKETLTNDFARELIIDRLAKDEKEAKQ